MANYLLTVAAALSSAALLLSCENLGQENGDEPGRIVINFSSDNPFTGSGSKAGNQALPDTNEFLLSVTDAGGRTVYSGKFGAAPEAIITDPGAIPSALCHASSPNPFSTPRNTVIPRW